MDLEIRRKRSEKIDEHINDAKTHMRLAISELKEANLYTTEKQAEVIDKFVTDLTNLYNELGSTIF